MVRGVFAPRRRRPTSAGRAKTRRPTPSAPAHADHALTTLPKMGTRHAGAPAGLLLAAGAGSRLGMPKALIEIGGIRLVDRGVRMLHEAGCTPIVVVTGAARVDVAGAVIVYNPGWRTGMGSSLRAGLSALAPDCPAVVIALVDQPNVTAEAVLR